MWSGRQVHAGNGIDIPAKFGGNFDLIAERQERFADHLFIGERTIRFRGVKKIDAALDRLAYEGDHFRPIPKQSRLAVTHASKGEGRNFKSAAAELALLHRNCLLPLSCALLLNLELGC